MFHRKHARVTFPRPGSDVGPLVTKQSHKAECDIHNILRQYQRTGVLTHVAAGQPRFMDLPDQLDFQASMNQVLAAQEAFASMPARVRDRFGNDPARLLEALSDPSRADELRELGILEPLPKPAPAPDPAPPAPEPEAS